MGCPTVAFATLGCKVNQYDTRALAELFGRQGFRVVPFDGPADVYVINTCSVTGEGERKSRQLIRQAVRRAAGRSAVVVTGCLAQVQPERLRSMAGVTAVVGTDRRARAVEAALGWLNSRAATAGPARAGTGEGGAADAIRLRPGGPYEELPVSAFEERSRAVVKVQDGCDEMCSFCIVPFTRGVSRSRSPQAVVDEVRRLVEAGFREVVISGIHLGLYGRDLPGGPDLTELLRRVEEVPGDFRVRLSSLLPGYVSDELIDWWGRSRRLCPHVHLSIQSGDDGVLRRMRRGYTVEGVREAVRRLRQARPDLAVSADVIVGFPGETEEAFERTARLVEELEVARLHVFPYSPRPRTAAARLSNDVPASTKRARVRQLLALAERTALRYHRRLVGRPVEVLVERHAGARDVVEGVDEHYVRVRLVGPEPHPAPGSLVGARVVAAGSRRVEAVLDAQARPA